MLELEVFQLLLAFEFTGQRVVDGVEGGLDLCALLESLDARFAELFGELLPQVGPEVAPLALDFRVVVGVGVRHPELLGLIQLDPREGSLYPWSWGP